MKQETASSRINGKHEWKYRFLPFLLWLPGITRRTVRADLMAGLTGAIVVLPQGVAFATIAGMPPEYGLYTGMIPAIIAALFGSSWLLVSGPTTAASIVLFSSLSLHAAPGSPEYVQLAFALTLMVGLIQLSLGTGSFRLTGQFHLPFCYCRLYRRCSPADYCQPAETFLWAELSKSGAFSGFNL